MMKPIITLIVTYFNSEAFLRESLQSVLDQSFSSWEVILWNDGSTDNSEDIALDFANKDSRFRSFNSPHVGRVHSLIYSCEFIRGDFVGILDSDDILEPTAFEDILSVFRNRPEIGLVYTNYVTIDRCGSFIGLGSRCQIPFSQKRMLLDFVTFQFRLIRTEIFKKAGGFDGSYPLAMDYDMCLRVTEITEVEHLKKNLYRYRVHPESLSYKRRYEQIQCSYRAVLSAIKRRGLENEITCDLELIGRHRIKKLNKSY